jgi:hypothetical protein
VTTEANKGWYYGRDTQPPVTGAYYDPGLPSGENAWDRQPVTVTLLAEDGRSGVDHTSVRVGSGAWQTYTAPIAVTAQGTTTLAYRSVDLLGNVEDVQTATVRIDSVPPTTEARVVTTATVALTGNDGTSGVAHTRYQVDAGAWQTYNAPFTVTEGVTTAVRYYSVDRAGNVEETQTITVPDKMDTTAPQTTASVSPPAANGWHRTPVTVTLSAQDDQSGVDDTYYRVSGGTWQTYATPITVTAQGTTTIDYYSVDVAGNVEAVQTTTVRIDIVAPTTTADLSPPAANGWHRAPVTVTLSAQDDRSGVDDTYYRVSGGAWRTYTTPITVTTQGTTSISYRSVDVAGNVEPVQTATVRLDSVPPTTEARMVTTATVALTGTDGTSGVAHTRYRIEGGAWQTYAAPFTVSQDVTVTVGYYSIDVAGNVEATQTITVSAKPDTTAPQTTASVSPPPASGWHRTPVTVTLSAQDVWSGVDYTRYRLNADDWQTYTTPIAVTTQGTTTVAYYSVDRKGNREATQETTVRLDSVPPTTVAQVVTETATVALTGTDGTSGVAQTYYRLDADGWQTYTVPISVTRGVTTTVRYYSVDVAGNVETEQRLDVFIERPEVEYRVYLPQVLRNR